MLNQDAVFASDHRTFFMDLNVESYFGHETDVMPTKQLRQLQLDGPRIADEYSKQLHKLFSTHNVYRRVTKISERSNSQEWSILDEDDYEKIDRDITISMLSAARKCGTNNQKQTPWSPALGMATQAIRYWDVRIKRQGNRNPADLVLKLYLMKSDVDKEAHDCTLPVQECIRQLNLSQQNLKVVMANAKEHRGQYEVQVAQAIVDNRNPRYKEGGIFDPVEKEILVEKEVKVRENRKRAQRSWRKLSRQVRDHIKPYMLKRSKLMHVEVTSNNETTWTYPGRELGHTGDIAMTEEILDWTLDHDCMKYDTIRAICQQLKRHPTIQGILTPTVSAKDLQSCFKCVPEKTASS
jgi:hypothetical protein